MKLLSHLYLQIRLHLNTAVCLDIQVTLTRLYNVSSKCHAK